MQLVLREGRQQYAQVDRPKHQGQRHHEHRQQVAGVLHLQHVHGEQHQHRRLHHREEPEPEHVAEHKLQAGYGGGRQPLHGALRALPQEGHTGQQEDQEEANVGYEHGREEIEHLQVGAAVQPRGGDLHRRALRNQRGGLGRHQ